MILSMPFEYITYHFIFEVLEIKEHYLRIGRDIFYLNGKETFESFEFKLNKRGGENGKIKFAKVMGDYKVGDDVRFYLKGEIVFSGVIQVLENNGLYLLVIPNWGLLDYAFITDSVILDDNKGRAVIEIVKSLKQRIIKQGINYNDKNVIIPPQYILTGSMAGKSLRAILDECEQQCPENYVWGVDAGNNFYFKQFSDRPKSKLNWHAGDFANDDFKSNTSNLASSYVVKIKNNISGFYNVLKDIVGDSDNYPPTIFTNIVGRKTKTFDLNFTVNDKEAYDYVYDRLRKQAPVDTLKVTTLDIEKLKVEPNEAIEVLCKPKLDIYEDMTITANIGKPSRPTQSSQLFLGEIVKAGYNVGYARKKRVLGSVLDFTTQDNYNDLCNRCFDIYRVEVYYRSPRSFEKFQVFDDEGNLFNFYGNGGFLRVDVVGFDKRSLKLRLIDDKKVVSFYQMRCYFNQGSATRQLNVRNIDYKFSKGVLTCNIELSRINSILTGYIFEEQQRLKSLEKLLTQSN